MLLERAPKSPVDHVNATGFPAMHTAAQYQHADIIRLLADRGANVSSAGPRRFTALRLAVGQIHPDDPPRDPDPDGARQLASVRALLRLGAGTLTPPRPPGAEGAA